jgi:hypothetical protein
MFMIMFVLDDPDLLDQILNAWSDAQVTGVTIIETTGVQRHQHKRVPMRYSYGTEAPGEKGNMTLFAIVGSEVIVQACLNATERITGDLNEPDTGVFASWPLSVVKGVPATTSA